MNNEKRIDIDIDEDFVLKTADKRRFNEQGDRIDIDDSVAATDSGSKKSALESELETKLNAEINRREAAEAKLVGVQAKFDEAKTGLEKETAEMRARLTKTLEDRAKQGQFNFLIALLPVLDNLSRAIEASEKDSVIDHLREGVKGTARSFEQALMSVGVDAVPSVGAAFDPQIHEAIDMIDVDSDQDGIVTAEYSRGYKLGDKLLRPAKVQVGKGRAQSAS